MLDELEQLLRDYEQGRRDEDIDTKISLIRLAFHDKKPDEAQRQRFVALKRRYAILKRKCELRIELQPEEEKQFDIMEHGRAVQKASQASLMNTLKTAERAKILAAMTSEQLAKQMEQIASMGEVLDTIEPELVRANRHIKRMTRGVACNKLLWVLIFFIVVGIGAIIYLKR